jgi:cytochrome c
MTADHGGDMAIKSLLLQLACGLGALWLSAPAQAAGDPQRGAQVFRACVACHSVAEGEHLTGPSLAHVWDRKAGSAPGFQRYSDAMRGANVVWDEATLDKWLANPQGFIPGTSMAFAGLKKPKDRQDVIAYLRAASKGEAKPPKGSRMQDRKPDLKTAPPQGQVTALKHCGDTYAVTTADGQTQKIWEFNLRLKTDSSKYGPAPGKPVVVGTGMQGDRAAIVFANPAEISAFIKPSCP